jgi:hypothetical protein
MSLELLAELRAGRYALEVRTRRQESAVRGGVSLPGAPAPEQEEDGLSEVEKKPRAAKLGLESLAGRINKHHRDVNTAVGRALNHARMAGKLLAEAKPKVRHGEWLPWLEANFQGSERVAQMYMRVYSCWEEIEANTKSVSDLTLSEALSSIESPRGPLTIERADGPLRHADVGENAQLTRTPVRVEGEPAEATTSTTWIPVTEPDPPAPPDMESADPNEVVEVRRLKIREYIVRFGDSSTGVVHGSLLQEQGWRKCHDCGGHGMMPPKDK